MMKAKLAELHQNSTDDNFNLMQPGNIINDSTTQSKPYSKKLETTPTKRKQNADSGTKSLFNAQSLAPEADFEMNQSSLIPNTIFN